MKTLFAPAVALMNRLRYRSKFLLLGTALTVVLGVLLFSVYSLLSRDIQTAQNELNGLQMVKPLNRMVQYMQQHRGLSSGVLNGNEAMKDKRAAKEKEVVEAVVAARCLAVPGPAGKPDLEERPPGLGGNPCAGPELVGPRQHQAPYADDCQGLAVHG